MSGRPEYSNAVIELSVNSESGSPEEPSTSGGAWFTWMRGHWLVLGAIIVVALGALVGYRFVQSPSPESIAWDFMESVRDGEVDEALSLLPGLDPYAQEDLLAAEALNDQWEIVDVETMVKDEESGGARVQVTISDGDSVEESADLSFRMNDNQEWELSDVLTYIEISGGSLSYLEANGHKVPLEESEEDKFALLPGLYEFYSDEIEDVEVEPVEVLTIAGYYRDLGGNVTHRDPELSPNVTLRDTTIDTTQARFNEVLDECVELTDSRPEGCPFGLGENISVDDESAVEWEVLEYPAVSVTPKEGSRSTFEFGMRSTGAVKATGDMVIDDRPTSELECEITSRGMDIVIVQDLGLVIAPFELPAGFRENQDERQFELSTSACDVP